VQSLPHPDQYCLNRALDGHEERERVKAAASTELGDDFDPANDSFLERPKII
jgi:hypothetical protein